MYIPYDNNFRIWTLPTTRKGTAKVLPSRGIKINSILYWCDAFRNPEIEKKNIEVRYDPYNAGIAYAFICNQWIECFSQYYCIFQGRSEKELMVATNELRSHNRLHSKESRISAKKLAEFLQSVEAEEKLTLQKMRDRESRSILSAINCPTNYAENIVNDNKSTNLNQEDTKEITTGKNQEYEIYEDF